MIAIVQAAYLGNNDGLDTQGSRPDTDLLSTRADTGKRPIQKSPAIPENMPVPIFRVIELKC